MRRSLVALALLVACKGGARPDPARAVAVDAAPVARAASPPDAHPPEKVIEDGGTDTTSAASMVKAETAPVSAGTSTAVKTTIARPFPHGDAHGAKVAVARGTDAKDLVARVLDGAGVAIPTDRPVIIKVNLNGFDRMKPGKKDDGVAGRITDPAFTRALIENLRARGCTMIALADGGAESTAQLKKVLALSGYQQILDDLAVRFLDLDHIDRAAGDPEKRALHLPWAHDLKDDLVVSGWLVEPAYPPFVIDVAKMKTHRFAVMTLSIKNMMGEIQIGGGSTPEKRRWKMHAELAPWLDAWKTSKSDARDVYKQALHDFSERLADAYGVLAPDLAIVEGMPPEQGDGFAKVVPFGDGAIAIASANGCYADYVAAEYFGLADSDALEQEIGTRMPPAIAAVAARYFGGVAGLRKVKVVGDVAWLKEKRTGAWFKAMAPFQLNPPAP